MPINNYGNKLVTLLKIYGKQLKERYTMTNTESKINYHNTNDYRYSINAFNGTWNISDHNKIPEALQMFLMLSFKTGRINRVSLEEINKLLNEVWEGPGSMEKIINLTNEMRPNINFAPNDLPRTKYMDTEDDIPVADRGHTE